MCDAKAEDFDQCEWVISVKCQSMRAAGGILRALGLPDEELLFGWHVADDGTNVCEVGVRRPPGDLDGPYVSYLLLPDRYVTAGRVPGPRNRA